MLMLLMVVLFLVVVLSVVVIAVLVKGNESLKAQHRAYVTAVNSVYDNHADIIIGLQAQVEDLLAKRADDQAVISGKDHHIAGLVKEVSDRQAVIEAAFEEAWSLRVKAEELNRKNLSLKKDRDKACEIADSLYRQ